MSGVISQPKTTKATKAGASNAFGPQVNDANRTPVQHMNFIQTNDATTPDNLLSPLAITSTPKSLLIPTNAVNVILIGSAIFNVSEVSDMSQYAAIPANTPLTLDVARIGSLYFTTATTANLSFIFQTL